MLPYGEEPPDRVIGEDDIVVADLGPVLAASETEFTSTVVFGEDPVKHRLLEDLPKVFAACREVFLADAGLTGGQLHAEVQALAAKAGWTPGGWHAGDLVGEPPGARLPDAEPGSYICPDNDRPLRRTVRGG